MVLVDHHIHYTYIVFSLCCKVIFVYIFSTHAKLRFGCVADRSGLHEHEAVENIQDAILGAYKRYIAENRPHQPVHWAKILMKVTDLRTISTRHAERVLCIRLDNAGAIPQEFVDMFHEPNGTV
jgi:hypothetical protein